MPPRLHLPTSKPPLTVTVTPTRAFTTSARRHANLIKRPRRPYTFAQVVQLSDGSTYTCRTTSPLAMYKAVKDTRNHIVWQPSEQSLQDVEVDEAGKLAAFRERYGRGFDAVDPRKRRRADRDRDRDRDRDQDVGKEGGGEEVEGADLAGVEREILSKALEEEKGGKGKGKGKGKKQADGDLGALLAKYAEGVDTSYMGKEIYGKGKGRKK